MSKVSNPEDIVIFSGSQYIKFAEEVANNLGVNVSPSGSIRFANSEVTVNLSESVRGKNVFIFQTHNAPVNEAIMEQAILIDAAKRASAAHITAVCPIFGYARQDRRGKEREPITAKLVANILKAAGADRIVAIDLHSSQIEGFFDGPFDHITAAPAIEEYIKKYFGDNITMVSPDAGRVKQTEKYSNNLGVDMAIIHKLRSGKNKAKATTIIGDVMGKHCVINDDMIDTGGTICSAADLLKKNGATRVSVVATHGIFSDGGLFKIASSGIDDIAITNTIPLPDNLPKNLKIELISVTELVGSSIRAIHQNESVSKLFTT